MKIREILEKLRDTLSDDDVLKKYCYDHFNNQLQFVYLGQNFQSPPSDFPAIAIAVMENRRIEANRKMVKIAIVAIIRRESAAESAITYITVPPLVPAPTSGKKRTMDGFPLVEEFLEEIEKTLFRNQSKFKAKMKIEDAGSVPNFVYPVFGSSTAISFEYIVESR